jgi:hypothetical protein
MRDPRRLKDRRTLVETLINLGLACRGRRSKVVNQRLREAVLIARGLDPPDPRLTGQALLHLGGLEATDGQTANATLHFEEARKAFQACEDKALEAQAIMYGARILRSRDGNRDIRNSYEEAVRLYEASSDLKGAGRALACLAVAQARAGDATRPSGSWARPAATWRRPSPTTTSPSSDGSGALRPRSTSCHGEPSLAEDGLTA